jgi:galactokinase
MCSYDRQSSTNGSGHVLIPMAPSNGRRTLTGKELSLLYGDSEDALGRQRTRYEALRARHTQLFGRPPDALFSAPGRCEIGGNHTDHNGGRVLAATIDLDILGGVTASERPLWTLYSTAFDRPFQIDTRELEPNAAEHPTAQLLRGIAAGFYARGYRLGGINMVIDSEVLFASGLSSSAALEMLLGTTLNELFNGSSIDDRALAMIGQEAEDRFWGKPVGLLDQLTIAIGGLVQIDFQNLQAPRIERIPVSIAELSHHLVLVNPGGDHSTLTVEYKSIPVEMKEVARYFGKERLIELDARALLADIREVRRSCGDRALLRALHFFAENVRVEQQVSALKRLDLDRFLHLVTESGNSSWRLLQNCYDPIHAALQPIPVALALTEQLSEDMGRRIGYRVHGGGFGGSILAVVPDDISDRYIKFIEDIFGESSARKLHVRPVGCVQVGAALE